VANAMVGFHGADNPSIASHLALLFDAARDAMRAAGYFLLASQNALRVFAFVEAAAIAGRGLKLLSGLPEDTERSRLCCLACSSTTSWCLRTRPRWS
jgi:hypothetical protein